MTALFIANTTKQRHEFNYRMPESNRVFMQPIDPGHQMKILNDGSEVEIDYIVKQHAKYGLVSQEEAAKARGRYIGLVYSLGSPVKVKNMDLVYKHNDEELKALAKKNLATQAAAVNKNLADITREATGKDAVDRTTIEVVEEVKPGGRDAEVAEGAEVVKEGVTPRRGQSQRNRNR